MRAAVRHFITPDAASPAAFSPPSDEAWSMLIQMLVGPQDSIGEESVELTVCTPAWIAERVAEGIPPLDGRGLLIVNGYDWPVIERTLRERIERFEAEGWAELGLMLARLGRWEFEEEAASGGS